jgi:ABC-type uncharacterized transport system ATPase subunit
MSTYLIQTKGITKIYPDGTVALRNVDFELKAGEIHGLLGENGAGKTTLTKIIYGIIRPTSGEIFVEGRKVNFRRPHDALQNGIGMVQQHFALVGSFTALENIVLGLDINPRGNDAVKARERIERICEMTGLYVPLDEKIENLSLGARQRVEILKMLYRDVRVLILDEPTSSLTPNETEELFKTLVSLKKQEKSVIFITHKLKEVMQICDRITVLRKGIVSGKIEAKDANPNLLARMMVGRDVELILRKKESQPGDEILKVENLVILDNLGREAVRGVSFSVRRGEIFGIAGVEGNGQTELAEAISGMRKVKSGRILLDGREISNLTPRQIRNAGAALIPEDRTKTGLILEMNLEENVLLGKHREKEFLNGILISWSKVRNLAKSLVEKFNIVVPTHRSIVKSLSGGNQQKVVVSRELSRDPVFVLACQPTRGLDVASTEYMRNLLLEMRLKGKAILLISADLDEIIQLSDRIAVMYEGKIMDVIPSELVSREKIGLLMGGVSS